MSGYIGTQPVPQATQTRDAFTATSNQTSFATSGYTPNFLDVYLNGVKLAAADYTASNGSDVVLATGATTGDILEVVAYTTFDTANVTGAANFTVTGSFTSQGIDDNANSTAITIDASENVGIGTSTSLSDILTVDDTNPKISIRDAGTERAFLEVDSSDNFVLNNKSTSSMIFETSDSEAMRIDSSGNLLVGKTSADFGVTVGAELNANDTAYFTRSGGGTLTLNRLSSDGDIALFRKDGTTVGSIQTGAGGYMHIKGGNNTFGSGIAFNNQTWNPTNASGTITDNHVKLGDSGSRFTDLYLSGGVFLGGTGSANKLEDYEEGNWTPVLKGDSGTPSGQVYGIQLGTYTKIGRSVHVQAYVSVTNMGSGVGGTYAQLHGLPFNIASGHQYFSSGSFQYVGALGQNVNSLHGYGQHGADYVYALYQNGAGVSSSYLSPAGWGSAPTIMFGMTYFTDA